MRVQFNYRDHHGNIEERDVDMTVLGFDYTNHKEFGYQPGWFIGGWDYSRNRGGSVYRSFYLVNVVLPDERFNYKLFEMLREAE